MCNKGHSRKKKQAACTHLLVVIVVLRCLWRVYVLNGQQSLQLPQSGSTVVVNSNYGCTVPRYTVNLADGAWRYLKVSVALAYANKRLNKELENARLVRDLMITTLRSQCADIVWQ